MGAQHGAMWNNTRYYYNPITSKLEPIGFDGEAGTSISQLSAQQDAGGYYKQMYDTDNAKIYDLFLDAMVEMNERAKADGPAEIQPL